MKERAGNLKIRQPALREPDWELDHLADVKPRISSANLLGNTSVMLFSVSLGLFVHMTFYRKRRFKPQSIFKKHRFESLPSLVAVFCLSHLVKAPVQIDNIKNIARIAKAALHIVKLSGKSSLNVSFICPVCPVCPVWLRGKPTGTQWVKG